MREETVVSPCCRSLQVSLQEKVRVHRAWLCWDSLDTRPTVRDPSACTDTVMSGGFSWATTRVPQPRCGTQICTCNCSKVDAEGA